jgi:hypothetical protein
MIEAFVLAELESSRHREPYVNGVRGHLPLFKGATQQARALRREALAQIRGYGRHAYLFRGFPSDVTWKLVAVPVGELANWLYAHEALWLALSENSRLVRDGAANVGKVPVDQKTIDAILRIEEDLANGKSYQPLIAAALNESSPHVIAEGHTRATAYVRALDIEAEVEVIVAYSSGLATWSYYGRP